MDPLTVLDVDVRGKRVFVRVDFNVPLYAGSISDDTRIRAALPTIRYLVEQGARVILASHLGRPKGEPDPALSLSPVRDRLAELLGRDVAFCLESIGEEAVMAVAALADGDVLLLENVRFHRGEEKNDPTLAAQWARMTDVYVNDAFGAAHRAHATTEGLARLVPVAVAGLLMERELSVMGAALEDPHRPFVAIIGGAKVSDKIKVIEHLLAKVDRLLIGGGMANTFLLAQGHDLGKSLVEPDQLEIARALLALARQAHKEVLLPVDVVLASRFAADATVRVAPITGIGAEEMALDIGPASQALYAAAIADARTVIWNGPMGVFEMPAFAAGTAAVAQAVADVAGTTIIGGGDSVAAIEQAGLADRMTHISTGGGASLEFLEGRALPGVEALTKKGEA
ncbi:MAG: phosphoglycerate kinase [Firmicutes bacterium]|nr:phosphoglycerate kinase [Bacillota bacterium]